MLFDSLQSEPKEPKEPKETKETKDSMEADDQAAITEVTPDENEESKSKGYFMFLGDTVPSFYRRPSSSKEGLFSVIPCGKAAREG